jgi:TfoX N-terminal domain
MAYDAEAAARVRAALAGRPGVTEGRMVGGLAFLISGHMCCGVTGDALMVRVGPDDRDRVLTEEHVRPMELGGRRLGGFVCVEPAGYRTPSALAAWIQRGLDFVSGLPPKPGGAGGSRPPRKRAGGYSKGDQ